MNTVTKDQSPTLNRPYAESQSVRFKSHIRTIADIRKEHGGGKRFLHNLRVFFTDAWLDVLTIVIVGVVAGAVWVSPHAFDRLFPVTFYNASGDVVYPELSYPYVAPIFSSGNAAIVAIIIPGGIILVAQLWEQSFVDAANGILGLAYSLVMGTCFQVILKKTIGGLRPHFLSVCQPVIPQAATGRGFNNIMFTIDQVCTGTDRGKIGNAIESFPSGHSEIAFAGFGYLSLYLFTHLRILGRRRPSHWKMVFVVVPLLLATYLASTLVLTYNHQGYDVVFGSLIGMFMALLGYRMVYRSIWDRHTNYIPSGRGSMLEGDDEADVRRQSESTVTGRKGPSLPQ